MKTFEIIGVMSWQETCVCEFCRGHERTSQISEIIQAETEDEAIDEILDRYRDDGGDWDSYYITELTEDRILLRLPREIAPLLPGMELER